MAFIAPFRALRYNPAKVGCLDEVVTPPYDIIDENARSAFLARNAYSMIQLDLSKVKDPLTQTDERYTTARRLFDTWQADGVLVRDERPAIYLYMVEYTLPNGRRLTRKGFVSLLRLADFSEGIVKPHEKTFSGVTSDRLRLIDTCQAQFSQIFSLYSDPSGSVMARLEAAKGEPLSSVIDQDGCCHSVFAVTCPETIRAVHDYLENKPVYIADGHHRYTTALQWRELMRGRLGGALAEESPYNHTMMYLCPMEDPGLAVLPTHRLVRYPERLLSGASVSALLERLAPCFTVEELTGGGREVLVGEALFRMEECSGHRGNGCTMLSLYHPGEDRCFLLTLKPGVMEERVKAQPEALRKLDVVVLSDLVLTQLLGLAEEIKTNERLIEFFSDPDEAMDVAVKESNLGSGFVPLLFLINSTAVSQVQEVADAGLVMPHKSTYFYPKIITGLLLNKVVAEETVLV